MGKEQAKTKRTRSVAKAAKGAKPALPRKPGRPSAAGNIDLRERVLDAAIALFAERGIAATPLRAIAQGARVTPALLHYYFRSRDRLVETLLAERVAPFVATSATPLLKPLPSPRATLRLFLETHMRNLAAHPWMPRLMAREVLSEGGSLRERMQMQFSAALSPKILMLIAAAQRAGEIRRDLDPLLIGLSLISLAVFPFAAAPVWRGVMKHAQLPTPSDEDLIRHTLALFDSALEKPDAKSKR